MNKPLTEKSLKFNKVLIQAKYALDSINIPFHLHSGTALGAHREHDFIAHDDDIDLAVFYKDVNTERKVKSIIASMENNGFKVQAILGTLKRGFELKFNYVNYNVGLDIFWVYPGRYRGQNYYILGSYYGQCDQFPYKMCVWGYRPYQTIRMNFLGNEYNVMPEQTLVDAYGPDWRTPKKFTYTEGLAGGYKSLIPDYYNPVKINKKIAFCFLVYDRVIHNNSWLKFFNEDKGFLKSYTIYSHIKEINNNTQQWLIDHSIPSIQTGWCEESLILAWILMLREALKDPNNEYFILLSGECIPLFGFQETYNKITSTNKARINININAKPAVATGLLWADQWVLLTRPTAIELIKLMTTKQGHDFITKIRKIKGSYCSDELYPVNWFAYKYGNPNSIKFRKYFDILPTTYTYWDGKSPHPVKYDVETMRKDYNKICGSKALFARKFEQDAGAELSGTCPSRS